MLYVIICQINDRFGNLLSTLKQATTTKIKYSATLYWGALLLRVPENYSLLGKKLFLKNLVASLPGQPGSDQSFGGFFWSRGHEMRGTELPLL